MAVRARKVFWEAVPVVEVAAQVLRDQSSWVLRSVNAAFYFLLNSNTKNRMAYRTIANNQYIAVGGDFVRRSFVKYFWPMAYWISSTAMASICPRTRCSSPRRRSEQRRKPLAWTAQRRCRVPSLTTCGRQPGGHPLYLNEQRHRNFRVARDPIGTLNVVRRNPPFLPNFLRFPLDSHVT